MGSELVSQLDDQGNEIVRTEYDLIFTSKDSFRNLTSDWEYTIVGFADNGVKDLDLKLYVWDESDEKWVFVNEDKDSESYAIIKVKPPVSALYKVEVIVYKFHEGYNAAQFGLLYVHD